MAEVKLYSFIVKKVLKNLLQRFFIKVIGKYKRLFYVFIYFVKFVTSKPLSSPAFTFTSHRSS